MGQYYQKLIKIRIKPQQITKYQKLLNSNI